MNETLQPLFNSVLVIVGIIFLLAALLDFLYYRLPNKLFYVLFYLFPIYIILSFKFYLVSHYLVFVGFILIGFGLFSAALIGGGDAKLLAAISLWVGWNNMTPFVLLVVILGGIISCAYLIIPNQIHHLTAQGREFIQKQLPLKKSFQLLVPDIDIIEEEIILLQQKRMIPYGISIAGAGFILLLKGIM